jgi:hypothetical protein
MKNLGIFYDHLVYFTAIGNIYYGHYVGIFCGDLVYFPPFWYLVPRIIWQPCIKGCFFEGRKLFLIFQVEVATAWRACFKGDLKIGFASESG